MLLEREIYGEEAMGDLGSSLAAVLKCGGVVYFEGDLGMGKTTLVRGVLHGLGYVGPVKSPTYTIVEPYEVKGLDAFHFDLYRMANAEELEYMGIRDYFSESSLCLIEWAEMGAGVLPEADLVIRLSLIRQGRKVFIESQTERGHAAMISWSDAITA